MEFFAMALKKIIQKHKKRLLLVLGVVVLFLAYAINLFDINNSNRGVTNFPKFQKDSENLVVTSVLARNYTKVQFGSYGLGFLKDNKAHRYVFVEEDVTAAKQRFSQTDIQTIRPYKSLVGVQGYVISFFYRLGIRKFVIFRLITALLLALVLVVICYMIYKKYNGLLAGICFVTFALSPWLTAFARNLYWMSFLWFLPLLLVFVYQQTKTSELVKKRVLLGLIGAVIFIKSLGGYEYLSSIMIIAVTPIVLDFFKLKTKAAKLQTVKTFMQISVVMVLGFVLAFTLHASMRGEGNIVSGAKDIYEKDIKRRLSVGQFHSNELAVLNKSKQISTIEVLKKYASFDTQLLTGLIGGNSFMLLVVSSFLFLVVDAMKNYQKVKLELIVWILTLLAPLSWYILAKPHSYIHTHMNYVLWYFGFIQVTLYVIVKRALLFIKNFKLERGA